MAASIVTQDLTKVYGRIAALDRLAMTVDENIVFGLLGPNGAGKTTLLRLLTTITKPTTGHATVLGYDIATQGIEVRRRIGVVAQEDYLDEYLTARENLIVHARMHRMAPQDYSRRIDEVLQWFELSSRQNDRPKEYSGGMRRRLVLARALLHRPRLLFLDEPTTGLDPQARQAVWDQVEDLRGKVSIFLTTHYMEEADALCDRVAIMDQGRILVDGSPAELKSMAAGGERYEIEVRGTFDHWKEAAQAMGLPGVTVSPGRDSTALVSIPASASLRSMLDHLDETSIVRVSRRAPTMADVFIQMTGRRLRD